MASSIAKVTGAGQVTIPKALRQKLGIDDGTLLEFVKVGDALVLKRVLEDEEFLDRIRKKIKKSGISRARVMRIVEEVREEKWREHRAKAVR